MAWATRGNGAGFFATLTLTDTQGDKSTMEFELQSADYAAAVTDLGTITTAIDNFSACVVSSRRLAMIEDEDAFVFPPAADVSIKARMQFQIENSVKKASRDVPGPAEGVFIAPSGPNGNVIDVTDAAVIAVAQIFQTGGQAFLSDGEISEFLLKGQRVSVSKGVK